MRQPLILQPFRRTVADAEDFARAAHALRKNKAGDQYINHLTRVVGRTSAKIPGLSGMLLPTAVCEMLQIAWLHDVIEDTPYDSDHLRAEGFSERVLQGVFVLSNRPSSPYPSFIAGICRNAPLAVLLVKLSDNEDTADPERLAKLDEPTRARLLAKYEPSMAMLRDAARAKGWQG